MDSLTGAYGHSGLLGAKVPSKNPCYRLPDDLCPEEMSRNVVLLEIGDTKIKLWSR